MQLTSIVDKKVVSCSIAESILVIKFNDGSQLYM